MHGYGRRATAGAITALGIGGLLLLVPASARAQSSAAGGECCLSLLFPIGARAMALGNAIVARTYAGSFYINPALLSEIEDDEFFVHNLDTDLETTNTFSVMIRSRVAGSFALSYQMVDKGEQEIRTGGGNPTGTISLLDQVVTATYSTPVAAGFNAGVSYKLIQERRDCQGFCSDEGGSATTHGVDLGVQFKHRRVPALVLGASVSQLGFALQVINAEQSDPLPTRLRIGAAYEVLHHFRPDSAVALWLSADVVDNWNQPGGAIVNVGAELSVGNAIWLWAGHGGGSALYHGIATGVGLKYNRFDVAVGKTFASSPLDERDPVQVTFGIRF
ncbi:MAG: PorV/PorQ family protein [Longimicrobiales bacterium]